MPNTTGLTSTTKLPAKLTVAQIRQLTEYKTNIATYQMLRAKNVQPVSFRKQPGRGGDIGEYDTQEVLRAFRRRLDKVRRDSGQEHD